ncbi:MAG: CapA family protein, partial [Anaerolineales bacterium]|nr:CapA family protein [Anaerolineales bacterium]
MKKGLFLLFWGVLCLAGCVREPQAATPAATRMVLETPDSPATTAVPPLPALVETPAATAAVDTAVSAPPLALQLTPQTAVSTLPAIPLALRWRYDTADVATALDLYSLDGGPLPDLLVGAADGRVVTLGLAQSEYWRAALPAAVHVLVGADLDEDGIGDVLSGSDDGLMTVFEGGVVRWQTSLDGAVTAVLLLAQPVSDNLLIAASGDGRLTALTRDGEQRWSISLGGGRINQLAQADVYGDGVSDVLAVDDAGQVTAVTQQGELLWQTSLGSAIRQLVTPDLNGDGATEVIVGTHAGTVAALTSTGGVLWRQELGTVVTAVAAADLNGDGLQELLAAGGLDHGMLTAFDENGQPLWQSLVAEGGIWAVTVGDVDGDGRFDLALGSDDGQVLLLDASGHLRGQFVTRGPVYALYLADIDQGESSPRPELVARAGDAIYLLDTMGSGIASADAPDAPPATAANLPADLLNDEGVTLLALGDLSLAGAVAERRWLLGADGVLGGIRPLLDSADLVAVNLETVLSPGGTAAAKADLRLAPPTLAAYLRGVDVALLANDHSLDFGLGGLNDTLAALLTQNVAYAGVGVNGETAVQPALFTVDGLRFAFLSFSNVANTYAADNQPGVARADAATITAAVTA